MPNFNGWTSLSELNQVAANAAIEAAKPRPKSLARALQLLAYRRDADGIARYLLKRGFKGCSGEAGNCPLANYLRATTGAPEASVLSTSSTLYEAGDGGYLHETAYKRHEQDGPLATFVRKFDGGYYPSLRLCGIEDDVDSV